METAAPLVRVSFDGQEAGVVTEVFDDVPKLIRERDEAREALAWLEPQAEQWRRQGETHEHERDEARACLKRFIVAVEGEDELLSNSAAVWNAYETARLLLGKPVISYPGGYEGTHFHIYDWQTGDACDVCDDEAEVIE